MSWKALRREFTYVATISLDHICAEDDEDHVFFKSFDHCDDHCDLPIPIEVEISKSYLHNIPIEGMSCYPRDVIMS